jgi:membrane-associated phospholipid phosphatase
MEKWAKIISAVFHPLLLPSYGMILLFTSDNYINYFLPLNYKFLILGMFFFITVITPITLFYIMYLQRFISNINISDRSQRTMPYMITAIMYLYSYYLLKNLNISPLVLDLIAGTFFCLLAVLCINLFWKISAHTAAVGGVIAAIYYLNIYQGINLQYFFILSILLFGLVASSRLKLNAHSVSQVYAGVMIGFYVMLKFLI